MEINTAAPAVAKGEIEVSASREIVWRVLTEIANWPKTFPVSPTEPQARGWPAIQSGRHTLISAPTGSGKTLAAFLASLDMLFRQGVNTDLPDETQVVYVSPLKALSNDIRKEPARTTRWHSHSVARRGNAGVRSTFVLKFGRETPALHNAEP